MGHSFHAERPAFNDETTDIVPLYIALHWQLGIPLESYFSQHSHQQIISISICMESEQNLTFGIICSQYLLGFQNAGLLNHRKNWNDSRDLLIINDYEHSELSDLELAWLLKNVPNIGF